MRRLIIDLDDTICSTKNGNYVESAPNLEVISRIREYKQSGFDIVIHSSRNMRTYEGNLGKITAFTVPTIIEWLKKHDVPYDEIVVGKPWCGHEGFYVDDRAIRPSEFKKYSIPEITRLLEAEK